MKTHKTLSLFSLYRLGVGVRGLGRKGLTLPRPAWEALRARWRKLSSRDLFQGQGNEMAARRLSPAL